MKISAGRAELHVTEVVLENGLTVDEILVRTDGASYDADLRTFALPGKTAVSACISAESIVRFLRENPPSAVQDLQVVLQQGDVRVSARMQGLLPVGVEAIGRLEIVRGTQIAFRPSSVRVAGMGAPESLVERVLESVNPLLDLSALPISIHLHRVEVSPGEVRIEATGGPMRISGDAT